MSNFNFNPKNLRYRGAGFYLYTERTNKPTATKKQIEAVVSDHFKRDYVLLRINSYASGYVGYRNYILQDAEGRKKDLENSKTSVDEVNFLDLTSVGSLTNLRRLVTFLYSIIFLPVF